MKRIISLFCFVIIFVVFAACGSPSADIPDGTGVEARDPGHYITDPYSADIHYSTGRLRTTTAVMQSFDLDTLTGNIYYSQLIFLF